MYIEKVQPETLLEQSMLDERPLKTAFNVAAAHGWDPRSFYKQVDGIGATLIIPTFKEETAGQGKRVGGYVDSTGGASLSVAIHFQMKLVQW